MLMCATIYTLPRTIKITKEDITKQFKKKYLSEGYSEEDSSSFAEADYNKMMANIKKEKGDRC